MEKLITLFLLLCLQRNYNQLPTLTPHPMFLPTYTARKCLPTSLASILTIPKYRKAHSLSNLSTSSFHGKMP